MLSLELRFKPGLHHTGRKESAFTNFLTVVRKVIPFTQPTDNFLHTSSGSGLKQAFLNMGCIMSLSHKCSGLRTSLCLHKEKGVCLCRLCLWGNREARKGSDALWYSSPTWRPLQHTTCLLSLNMQSKWLPTLCWPEGGSSHLAGITQEKNNLKSERTCSDLLQDVLRWKLYLFLEVFLTFYNAHSSGISLGRTGLEISMVIHNYLRAVLLIVMHLLGRYQAGQPMTVWFFFQQLVYCQTF